MVVLTIVIVTHTAPDALFPPLPSTIISIISYPNSTIATTITMLVGKPQPDNYEHITPVIFNNATSKKSVIQLCKKNSRQNGNLGDGALWIQLRSSPLVWNVFIFYMYSRPLEINGGD